ncbi:MAG: hypothetical protein V4510_12800 [bacterium]
MTFSNRWGSWPAPAPPVPRHCPRCEVEWAAEVGLKCWVCGRFSPKGRLSVGWSGSQHNCALDIDELEDLL